MQITMLAVGSRGDIQPFVALGVGLQAAGYRIRLATHSVFEVLVRGAGLDFAPLEGNPRAITEGEKGREWLSSARNPFSFAGGFRKLMGPVIRQAMQDGIQATEDSDALIATGPAYYFGRSIAEKRDLPFIQAYAQPIHPTGAYPSALFPISYTKSRALNYFTHIAGGQMFWQLIRPVVNEARRDFLQLPPLPAPGTFTEEMRMRLPVLYGYSPSVLPKPNHYGDFIHVTGYWFLDQPEWTPPAALLDFLDAGAPPVYIGFGSMADSDPERLTALTLEALRQSGQRGVLLTGWGGLSQSDLPDTVFKIDEAPHSWLFPRMSAVVHHGGAGTTAAGLRAGKPTTIIPFFGDQPFWGQRARELGVGSMIERKHLTAERLAEAIRTSVTNKAMRANADTLGAAIRAETGIQNAVDVVTGYLDGQSKARHFGMPFATVV